MCLGLMIMMLRMLVIYYDTLTNVDILMKCDDDQPAIEVSMHEFPSSAAQYVTW